MPHYGALSTQSTACGSTLQEKVDAFYIYQANISTTRVFISTNLFPLLHYLMWQTHIIRVSKPHTYRHVTVRQRRQTRRRLCVVLVCSWSHLWIKCYHNTVNSGPLSATIEQKKKPALFAEKKKFWKPHAMLEVMACCVFGGGMWK